MPYDRTFMAYAYVIMKSGFVGTAPTVAPYITFAQPEGPASGFNTFYELTLSDWEQAVGLTCPGFVGVQKILRIALSRKRQSTVSCRLPLFFPSRPLEGQWLFAADLPLTSRQTGRITLLVTGISSMPSARPNKPSRLAVTTHVRKP